MINIEKKILNWKKKIEIEKKNYLNWKKNWNWKKKIKCFERQESFEIILGDSR